MFGFRITALGTDVAHNPQLSTVLDHIALHSQPEVNNDARDEHRHRPTWPMSLNNGSA